MTISESDLAFAWVWLPEATTPVVAGRLDRAPGGLVTFTYGRSYLERADAIPLYLPELPGRWQVAHPGRFTYIPVLSEPKPEDEWPGRIGLVHRAVLDDFPDLSGYQVYACGGPLMIDAARRDFTALRGLPPEEFFADSFTYAAEAEAR